MVVRGFGVRLLINSVGVPLWLPALFDSHEAPAGAVDRAADGMFVHHNLYRIGMHMREDSYRSPAAFCEFVFESDITCRAIARDQLCGNWVAIDDQLHRYIAATEQCGGVHGEGDLAW